MYTSINKKRARGFTLIELMVALSIFSMVMVIAIGAMLSALDATKRARSVQAVLMNLNYTIETMSRNIRYGKNIIISPLPLGNCIEFNDNLNKPNKYCFNNNGGADSSITLKYDTRSETPVTSTDEVNITSGGFSFLNDVSSGRTAVVLNISGEVRPNSMLKSAVPFSLRTVVSNRVPSI